MDRPNHYSVPRTQGSMRNSTNSLWTGPSLGREPTCTAEPESWSNLFVLFCERVSRAWRAKYNRFSLDHEVHCSFRFQPSAPTSPRAPRMVRQESTRPALAQDTRSVSNLDFGGHAAADSSRRGHPTLRGISQAVPFGKKTCFRTRVLRAG